MDKHWDQDFYFGNTLIFLQFLITFVPYFLSIINQ